MKGFILACLLAIPGLPAVSHASQISTRAITGIVLDSTRAPLPRAAVRLVDRNGAGIATTLTDEQGRFRFPGFTGGSYKVEAALTGFEAATSTAVPGAEVELVLALAPVHESIVVTATRTEAPTSQIGASTTVLDKSEIAGRQALS